MKELRYVAGVVTAIFAGLAFTFFPAVSNAQTGMNKGNDSDIIPIDQDTFTMGVGNSNPVAGEIKRVDNKNTVFQFWLRHTSGGIIKGDDGSVARAGSNADVCVSIRASNLGSAQASSDIENYELWIDVNNNGRYDEGIDTFQGEAANLNFTGLNIGIPKDGQVNLVITADVAQSATVDRTVRIEIHKDNVTLQAGNRITTATTITSNTHTIAQDMAELTLGAGGQLHAGNVYRGAVAAPIMQFTLTAASTGEPANLTSVTVTGNTLMGHTAVYADVVSVRLYREGGSPNGVLDGNDVQLGGNGTQSGGFGYVISGILGETIPAGTTRTYLVVATISATATNGNVFRMHVQQSGIGTNAPWNPTPASFTEDARTISDPLAKSLSVETAVSDVAAGAVMAAIEVHALLEDGSPDTSFTGQVTVSIETGPAGASFASGSITAVPAVNGVATFSNLIIQMSGTYRLQFASPPVPVTASAMTNFFDVTAGSAIKLVIAVQPANGKVGQAVPGATEAYPVVHALDLYNNIATGFSGQVTAERVAGPVNPGMSGHIVAAENGVATFDGLFISTVGTGYQLRFTNGGLTPTPASSNFNIDVGDPYDIQVMMQPTTTTGGQIINPHPRVRVVDVANNVLTGYSDAIQVAIGNNPGGGVLSGTTSVIPTVGVSEFTDLSINKTGNGYTLVFTTGSITKFSNGFDIVTGTPVKLGIVQQPSSSTGGIAFTTQPIVQVQDAGGNHVTTDNSSIVQVQITSGTGEPGAILSGVVSLTVNGGQAIFDGLSINKASATPYTLRFVTTTIPNYTPATSEPITITVGPAARVGLATQPGLATMGHPFVQQPVAQIQDMGGNHVVSASGTITVRKDTSVSPPGTTLQGTTALVTTGGQAAFTDLAFDLPGLGFVLIFESGALLAAHSNPFNVASTATHLAVVVQPGQGAIDAPLSIQPVVEIRDAAGVLVSVDNFSLVTAEIVPGTGAPGATLTGQTSVYAVNGVATFNNLKIATQGLSYHLRFTSTPPLTPANSTAFNIAGIAVKVLVTRQPAGAAGGEQLSVQPKVTILDSNNTPVISDSTTVVTAYILPATGSSHAILGGTVSLAAINGVVEFTDLTIDRPGTGYKLGFSAMPVLQQAVSASFDMTGDTPPQAGTKSGIPGSAGGGCSTGNNTAPWLLLGLVLLALGGTVLRRARN